MMLSDWIRKREYSLGMTDRQFDGAIFLAVILFVMSMAIHIFPKWSATDSSFSGSESIVGKVVVELSDSHGNKGIYFLPEKANLSDLLYVSGRKDLAGIDQSTLDMKLSSGMEVFLRMISKSPPVVVVKDMNASKRLALNLQLGLNSAKVEDLKLIPGIGEKTAEKIVLFRKEQGKYKKVDDLVKVKGIKEKRLSKLRKYFFID